MKVALADLIDDAVISNAGPKIRPHLSLSGTEMSRPQCLPDGSRYRSGMPTGASGSTWPRLWVATEGKTVAGTPEFINRRWRGHRNGRLRGIYVSTHTGPT